MFIFIHISVTGFINFKFFAITHVLQSMNYEKSNTEKPFQVTNIIAVNSQFSYFTLMIKMSFESALGL